MKNEPLSHRMWAKVLAYVLLTACFIVLAASAAGIWALWEGDFYSSTPESLKEDRFRQVCADRCPALSEDRLHAVWLRAAVRFRSRCCGADRYDDTVRNAPEKQRLPPCRGCRRAQLPAPPVPAAPRQRAVSPDR